VTLVEVIVLVLILGLLASIVLPMLARPPEEARRTRCRNYLSGLAKGMATYLVEYGDRRWFPCPLGRGQTSGNYNGAEWLASLYWTGIVPDTIVFNCPSSGDDNDGGRQLGRDRAIPGLFGSQTVSYAGMHYYSLRDDAGNPIPGAIADDYWPNLPMASDDTQGDINHGARSGGGLNVLYFDSHVDCVPNTLVDVETGVGATGEDELLRDLRN